MESIDIIGAASIISAGIAIGLGTIGPGLGEGIAISRAMTAIAQQPDESNTLSRNLFVGLAMIESIAIYAFVVAIILIFANPFWNYVVQQAGG